MRIGALTVAAALAVTGVSAAPAQTVESGYARGALAVAAMERGDWARAEALLTRGPLAETANPAHLINLGQVYMATGRKGEALSAWRLALAQPRHEEVVLLDGRVVSTDALARAALDRHEGALRSAGR